MDMEKLVAQITKEVFMQVGNSELVDSAGTGISVSQNVTALDIAKMIDHSLLKPEMTRQQVIEGCELADKYDCATVCVKPCDVVLADEILKNSDVMVTTVIGFPHGSNLTETKVMEAQMAMSQGCEELDLVMNIGRFKSGDYDLVEKDIKAVADVAHKRGIIVKVIMENFYLTDEEITRACQICERAGADFVKTSTGYAGGGATVKDLQNMRRTVSSKVRVKAAGGVRTLDAALTVRKIGGIRFGCTATQKIVEDAREREKQGTLKLPEQIKELTSKY
jgi:deoxyribose-phosphate aldolase